SLRSCRLTPSSTDSAIMASIGSPGVRWMSAKTPAVTSRSTGIVATSRRRISRPTAAAAGLLQPDVLEAHHAVRDRVVALHPRAEGLGLDRVDDEDHRQLVLQDAHELAEELLALGLARELAGPVEQGIDLRVGDARPVERGAGRRPVELEGVAVRIRPPAPLVADHLVVL